MAEHKPDSVREEVSAAGERAKGAIKDAVGDAVDNESLEREGEAENARGQARQAANDAVPDRGSAESIGEELSATGERVKGGLKDAAGELTGNESLEREGEEDSAEGKARQQANNAVGDDRETESH